MRGRLGVWVLLVCVVGAACLKTPSASAAEAETEAKMIRVERVIEAPIERVWEAWTTAEGFQAAVGSALRIELRPGGAFEIAWDPSAPEGERGSEGCTVLSFLPRRMLSFSWSAPPKFPALRSLGPTTVVVVQLEALGARRTRVTLAHHGWLEGDKAGALREQWDGAYSYFEAAWPKVLEWMDAGLGGEGAVAKADPKAGWTYFLRIARGVAPDELTKEEVARIGEHAAYLQRLTRDGVVLVAGPCTDFKGPGIVIFEAPDEEAARRIMEDDPAVKAGVFVAELHPMALSFVRGRE